jgi:hypothetical protein
VAADDEIACRRRVLVDADGENGQVGLVVVEFESEGISSMQGAHQLAQKLSSTTLPR